MSVKHKLGYLKSQHDFFVFRLTWDEREREKERESFCVGIFVGHVVDGCPKG